VSCTGRRSSSSPPAPTIRSTSTGSGGLKNCIAYGPGILDLAHQPDEWVGIDDMVDSAKVMALTLQDLLV
jgi:acetylornithine deacetylase/succinyl-diaminopimelate desuccinylase-like protein